MTICPKCDTANWETEAACFFCGEELKGQSWWKNNLPQVLRAIGKGAMIAVAVVSGIILYLFSDQVSDFPKDKSKTKAPRPPTRKGDRSSTKGSGFQTLVTDSDVSTIASGRNPEEILANAARGMYSVFGNVKVTQQLEPRQVSVTGPDLETLLVNWLNELLHLFQIDGVLFTDFSIHTGSDQKLEAVCTGNQVDLQGHPTEIALKAASAHSAKVYRGDGIDAEVILDRSH